MNFLEVFRRYKTLSKEERQMMFIYWSSILESYKIFSKKEAKYLDSPVWDNHKLFRINDKSLFFRDEIKELESDYLIMEF